MASHAIHANINQTFCLCVCRRRLVAPVRAEYKFGDLTRGLMKGAKEQLNKLGQSVTGAAVL